jgi:penicillin-binding protein 1A
MLAGLPQAPSIYDPLHDPQAALQRRDEVLQAMLANGVITPRQYRSASRSRSLGLHPGNVYTRVQQPYFFSYVTDQLEQQYGANTVREGGLQVYTTIDPRLQFLAKRAINDVLPYKTDPAAAIVSVEPGTGAIRAMTAVVRTKGNQFNLAAQSGRQAGSTFKTFVLATAIEKGIDPDSTYYTSAPFTCTVAPWCSPAAPWNVHTYGNSYLGTVSITRATLASDNTVYAQLTLDVGPRNVWNMAHRLGVHMAPDKPVASIGLGSLAVNPLDMAAAYATFPTGGIYAAPRAITKVVLPDGKIDKTWSKPSTKRVLSEGVAWKVTDVLRQNAEYGTGAGSGDGIHPNAGKTGTTENHADAWFDGYTRQLSTVVWMGYPSGEIPMLDVHGEEVAGATFPVPIWHAYMAAALIHAPAVGFLIPKHYPAYEYFHKGYFGSLAYAPSTTTTTTTTTQVTTAGHPQNVPVPAKTTTTRTPPQATAVTPVIAPPPPVDTTATPPTPPPTTG